MKWLSRHALTHAGIGVNRWITNRSDSLDNTVWVCGDGRSGTTWLSNIINHDNRYRFLFEPLHPVFGLPKDTGPEFRYMSPDANDPALSRLLGNVFLGRVTSRFVNKHNKRSFYRSVLVKDIFAHLYIRWADAQFPTVKKVVIIRNPLSVALSKRRLQDWVWLTDPRRFLEQDMLMQDHLRPHEDLIRQRWTFVESQVLIWSIIHHVLFKQCEKRNIHFLFYEDLCFDPDTAVNGLFQYLYGAPTDAPASGTLAAALQAPSGTSFPSHARGLPLDSHEGISQHERDNCNFIVRAFGLSALYHEGAGPDRTELARLTSSSLQQPPSRPDAVSRA
jgi:hypothetical protein